MISRIRLLHFSIVCSIFIERESPLFDIWFEIKVLLEFLFKRKYAFDGYSCRMTCLFKTGFKRTKIMTGDNSLELQYVLVTARNINAYEV